ncbi:MAG TPA: endonuclease/exonuclease/phosphatase family protein [Lacunisphaera sp.]|nr:endonuclease/exonuclease/phosphatase family protein [Lacunisphaera sp.]
MHTHRLVRSLLAAVALTLGACSTAPQRDTVAPAAESLTVCSFNIKFVGNFKDKDNTALANLLKAYDLVVVQELIAPPVATPTDTTRNRAWKFFQAMEAQGFRSVLSESDTGHATLGGNTTSTEYFVTFYKPAKVSPVTDLPHGFIGSPLSQNSSFKRVPYAFAFRTPGGKFDFVLVSVHLEPTDRVFRAGEFRAIASWLQQQYSTQPERDLIVLGDTNLQNQAELTANTPGNFISLNDACVRTNVALGSAKPFDHIFFNPQFTREIDRTYGFKVINLVEAVQPGVPLTTATQTKFFGTYSDHHPVVFRFKLPAHDDD